MYGTDPKKKAASNMAKMNKKASRKADKQVNLINKSMSASSEKKSERLMNRARNMQK